MNKTKITIWGRSFDLKVIFECYGDQKVTEYQKKALDTFLQNQEIVNDALPETIRFCLDDENLCGVSEIKNIFKYVMPQAIYIKRNEKRDMVILLCDYRFNVEHGLEIVFERGKFKEVSCQGGV